jgi:hypothetical protein
MRDFLQSSCPGKSPKRVFALDVPGIHVFAAFSRKPWMAGTRLRQGYDGATSAPGPPKPWRRWQARP